MRYGDKIFDLSKQLGTLTDGRKKPRISVRTVVSAAMVMVLARVGSLHALEQTAGNAFWRRWLGAALPSADTLGEVCGVMAPGQIRQIFKQVYQRLKRNKALPAAYGQKIALVIDGHEAHSSYLRCCRGCLQRIIHTGGADKTQYYHRYVMAQLLCGDFYVPLDMESQRPGEDEVAAAMRLLERVLNNYPRAFELILADGLYVRAGFFRLAVKHGKDVIAVLKDERRDLLKDALGVFALEPAKVCSADGVCRKAWDGEHFTSWRQFEQPVRVVRSVEIRQVKRQRTKQREEQISDWIWVSTLSQEQLGTEDFVKFGHSRWRIENNGFNELVNYWHADHVYRHHPVAMEVFWLLTMLAFIVFNVFVKRNVKTAVRSKHTTLHFARMVSAQLYLQTGSGNGVVPP